MSVSSTRRSDDSTAEGQRFPSLFPQSARGFFGCVPRVVEMHDPPRPGPCGSRQRDKAPIPVGLSWHRVLRGAACAGFYAMTVAIQAAGIFDVRIADEFSRVVDTNTPALMTNATVNYWLEGPVWVPANGGGYL